MNKLQELASKAQNISSSEIETGNSMENQPSLPPPTSQESELRSYMAEISEQTRLQVEALAEEVKSEIKKQVVDETKPFFLAVHSATTELRQLSESTRSNVSGLKHYLFITMIACIAGIASFFMLKYQLGLGVDADYGRRARAVIQQLDQKNRQILEQLIERAER